MTWLLFLLKFVLAATAVFMIILVLLQKGKGGGLAGALGGMGGQSAFGTKAGDLFTKITVGVAVVWILFCVTAAMWAPQLAGNPLEGITQGPGPAAPQNPQAPSGEQPGGSATKPSAPATSDKPASLPEPSSRPGDKPGK